MEAHEAIVAGLLGVAALYAFHRRGDPPDRLLTLVALWICVTGIIGLPLAAYGTPPWTYIRLALRLTGPPLLLVIAEESVRSPDHPGSRKASLGFAAGIWVAAVIGLIWSGGGAMFEARFDRILPLQLGVTAWMAMLAVTFPAALLTIVSAAFRRLNPGLAGIVATLLIGSEAWAAIDTRWGSGAIELGIPITYRNLFTLALAGLALAKALTGWRWFDSAASTGPTQSQDERPSKAPEQKTGPSAKKRAASKDKSKPSEAKRSVPSKKKGKKGRR